MNRRQMLIVFGFAVCAATCAPAATFQESVVSQLESQGYQAITIEQTLLGRVKIVGQIADGRREIILNPRTGEILRDLWMQDAGGDVLPKIRDNVGHVEDATNGKSETSDGHGKGGDSGGGTEGGGTDGGGTAGGGTEGGGNDGEDDETGD